MNQCPCGSGKGLAACCGPLLDGEAQADSAEALMRSRYSAYILNRIPYLGESLHPDFRSDYDEAATRRWAEQAQWLGLQVLGSHPADPNGEIADQLSDLQADDTLVEFIASFRDRGLRRQHHEIARFRQLDGRWYYLDGVTPKVGTSRRTQPRVGRNDPCSCGSGRKYKKCCGSA